MTTRKHNEFLEFTPSDEDESSGRGYDSETNEAESKGRVVKRRRTTETQDFFGLGSDEDESAEEGEEGEEASRTEVKGKARKSSKSKNADVSDDEASDGDEEEKDGGTYWDANATTTSKAKELQRSKQKPLSTKPLKAPKKNKTGVIYLSSLPPYLKPFALKSMLEARGFGPITKVFLSPLVPSASAPRRRSNKRKSYSDGWVEFASKKTAKICAETLNAHIVGGRKGGWYHDDVWNMKYLRGFKWADLMEQVQRERSEREAKQRIEDARARKEEKVFLAGVETGRVADGMARKYEEKRKRLAEAGEGEGGDGAEAAKALPPVRRRFVQNDVVKRKDEGALGDDAKRVLGKIF